MTKTTLTLAALLGAIAFPTPRAAADGASDDLAIVRKAVAAPVRAEAEEAPAPRARRGAEPSWFRVRIVEKGEKGARVKVNLPLSFVRALGDDLPLPACAGRGHGLTLGEVLRALDSGESLVEIDDEEASVRVWVE
jgi:hypothetical protein